MKKLQKFVFLSLNMCGSCYVCVCVSFMTSNFFSVCCFYDNRKNFCFFFIEFFYAFFAD